MERVKFISTHVPLWCANTGAGIFILSGLMDCVCAYQILDIEDMQLLDILKTQTNVPITVYFRISHQFLDVIYHTCSHCLQHLLYRLFRFQHSDTNGLRFLLEETDCFA